MKRAFSVLPLTALMTLLSTGSVYATDLRGFLSSRGFTCAEEVYLVLAPELGENLRVVSYDNLTQGSWDQRFAAILDLDGTVYGALFSGEYDCDALKLESLKKIGNYR